MHRFLKSSFGALLGGYSNHKSYLINSPDTDKAGALMAPLSGKTLIMHNFKHIEWNFCFVPGCKNVYHIFLWLGMQLLLSCDLYIKIYN